MKKFLIVLMLMALSVPSFAEYADANERLMDRLADKIVAKESFDVLFSTTAKTLDAAAAVNFKGMTAALATGSTAIAIPTTYPFKIKVQNLTANNVLMNNFAQDATSTTYPTAVNAAAITGPSGALAISGLTFEKVFYAAPQIQLGAATTTAVIIEIWTRSQ